MRQWHGMESSASGRAWLALRLCLGLLSVSEGVPTGEDAASQTAATALVFVAGLAVLPWQPAQLDRDIHRLGQA